MTILLRNATENDSRFLFDLRNETAVRRVSGNPDPISFETHSAWFERKLKDGGSMMFIVEEEGVPIAQTRFDTEGKHATISIAVVEKLRGKGYGSRIIRSATETFLSARPDIAEVRALINQGNEASLRSFAKAGFTEKGTKEEGGLVRHLFMFERK